MTGESAPKSLEEMFEVSSQRLSELHGYKNKTDRDFIGPDGNLDDALRAENAANIKIARDDYSEALADDLESLGVTAHDELGLTAAQKAMVYSDLYDGLHTLDRREPHVPESVESVIEHTRSRFEKLDEVLAWWSNPSDYFIRFGSKVSVFPSLGEENVRISGDYGSRISLHRSPLISADFANGHSVSIYEDRHLVLKHMPDVITSIGLHGWTGNVHAKLDEFGTQRYENYRFANAGESIEVASSELRFALRAALTFFSKANGTEIGVPEVALPVPHYRDELLGIFATTLVTSFAPNDFRLDRSGRSPKVKTVESPLLNTISMSDLHVYLQAAGIQDAQLFEAIHNKVAELADSGNIADRITRYKTKAIADQFIEEFLPVTEEI